MAPRKAIVTSLLFAWTAVLLMGPAVAQEMACQGAASATCTLDEGWIRGPEGGVWARFEWVDGKPVYQGDIVVEVLPTVSGDAVLKSAIVAGPVDTWSDGVIPYVIDSTLPSQGRVDDAIAHWNGKTGVTGVTLVPRTTQTDYVRFIPADGCWSYVGRTGGVQDIGLASGCYTGAVIHEIGHAAGLWHEQSRSDRDNYVTIQWDNIDQGYEHNFEQYSVGYGADSGPYDYASIMHYPAYAFSTNGQPTIVPNQAGAVIGQRDGLSQGDLGGVAALYGDGSGGGVTELQNGVPVYGLTGTQADALHFRLQVPSAVDELTFGTSGGNGDVDLYVKRGALPTTLDYDCRPWMDGNDESCSFSSPSGGDWYVMVRGYSAFWGVVLVGSYQEDGGGGISEWMGHSVFKASATKLGKRSWEGTSQMAIEGNGTFTYTDPKGTALTGPISQDGKKLYMALDSGSIAVLEEKMADMVWDEMTLSGMNPGWVDVEIDPWSVKLKAKLSPGKNGNRSSIKVKLSVKAWIDTGIGSSEGKLRAKMILYEP